MSPDLAAKLADPDPRHYTWTWGEFRRSRSYRDARLWCRDNWPRRFLSTLTDWDWWALDEVAEALMLDRPYNWDTWLAEWCRDYAPAPPTAVPTRRTYWRL